MRGVCAHEKELTDEFLCACVLVCQKEGIYEMGCAVCEGIHGKETCVCVCVLCRLKKCVLENGE